MKKVDKNNKRYAIRRHAIQRASQHYGLRLTDDEYQKLCKYIKLSLGKSMVFENGFRTEFIEKQSCSRSVWKIYFNDDEFVVIYDKTRKMINTFISKDIDLQDIQYKRWQLEDPECIS